MEDKYEALYELDQEVITYLNIDIDDIFNLNNFIITLFQELFRKFARDGVARYPSENLVLLVQ